MKKAFFFNSSPYRETKLTARELDVLYLISEEFNNNEIAKKLYISVNTVNTHRKSILTKLNARNSAGVIRKSFEYGILPQAQARMAM